MVQVSNLTTLIVTKRSKIVRFTQLMIQSSLPLPILSSLGRTRSNYARLSCQWISRTKTVPSSPSTVQLSKPESTRARTMMLRSISVSKASRSNSKPPNLRPKNSTHMMRPGLMKLKMSLPLCIRKHCPMTTMTSSWRS